MAKITYQHIDGYVQIFRNGTPFGRLVDKELVHEDEHLARAINALAQSKQTFGERIELLQRFVDASIIHKEI